MRIQAIQNLIDKVRGKDKSKIHNKIIKQYRFVHLMFNDKFNKPFVDFLNRNFDIKEHLVLCKRCHNEFPFPQGDNVIEIGTLRNFNFSSVEKIFCHSLFDRELVDYLYTHQDILKEKAYWQIWGGDLYNAPRDDKNDFVRDNFRGYITDVDGDKAVLEKRYAATQNKRFYHATYTFPVGKEMVNEAKHSLQKRNATIIQINNSCDDSTLEMLDILAKFKNENIIIKTILSYGKLEFKEQIIQKAREIYGVKFQYIDKMLPPNEYSQHLANIDILILNQKRQQGVGNTQASLYLGNKVFIRSDVTTYKDFNSFGIKIYDTKEIVDLAFNELISYPEKDINTTLIRNFIDETIIKDSWKSIFEN